jgi:hypothetical protein
MTALLYQATGGMVQADVLTSRQDGKILRPVIGTVSVDMVNILRSEDLASECLFCDQYCPFDVTMRSRSGMIRHFDEDATIFQTSNAAFPLRVLLHSTVTQSSKARAATVQNAFSPQVVSVSDRFSSAFADTTPPSHPVFGGFFDDNSKSTELLSYQITGDTTGHATILPCQ